MHQTHRRSGTDDHHAHGGRRGHIAGIVNPPAANKYCYWTNAKTPADPDQWVAGARQHDGSWWTDWQKWVKKYAGGEVDAREPGCGKVEPIEDAPGSYVKVRLS